MADVIYKCPECGSERVTTAHVQTFYANSGEHYCHVTKTHDSDSPAYCTMCCWRGERKNLVCNTAGADCDQ